MTNRLGPDRFAFLNRTEKPRNAQPSPNPLSEDIKRPYLGSRLTDDMFHGTRGRTNHSCDQRDRESQGSPHGTQSNRSASQSDVESADAVVESGPTEMKKSHNDAIEHPMEAPKSSRVSSPPGTSLNGIRPLKIKLNSSGGDIQKECVINKPRGFYHHPSEARDISPPTDTPPTDNAELVIDEAEESAADCLQVDITGLHAVISIHNQPIRYHTLFIALLRCKVLALPTRFPIPKVRFERMHTASRDIALPIAQHFGHEGLQRRCWYWIGRAEAGLDNWEQALAAFHEAAKFSAEADTLGLYDDGDLEDWSRLAGDRVQKSAETRRRNSLGCIENPAAGREASLSGFVSDRVMGWSIGKASPSGSKFTERDKEYILCTPRAVVEFNEDVPAFQAQLAEKKASLIARNTSSSPIPFVRDREP
ncbi:hypothetical protein BU24DRAFT_406766 [Aaosphaeria arxii CBS 175.79]|uniref:Uncharacterized protein n=1 Tax=Aaosphaeria arxii CBS 175.79 TaxID=1450172 RepID=A0A6A5Y4N9_9PLEO|nr:uncharacterized protein BU24DRAFT_406766 [Aaosphaeria arxii CBS 175.79]KAF2020173.1 hypothetical protein BU24DRAFT_406766 [Aaosphaeria arxii CBS 175.79]